MINIVEGNVVKSTENIIAHQVNCKGVMGSGVAKTIKESYPSVFPSYAKYCNLMGAELLGKIQMLTMSNGKIICNMFGQDDYGWNKQYTDIEALKLCFMKLRDYAIKHNYSIAMPYGIGCGRGRANWSEVYGLIQEYFDNPLWPVHITLYKYEGGK